MGDFMVTTMDNPWNPFTHYHEWLSYDTHHGYRTQEWLAILSRTSTDLRTEEQNELIDAGVQSLLDIDPYGLHVKVYSDEADTLIPMYNQVYYESK